MKIEKIRTTRQAIYHAWRQTKLKNRVARLLKRKSEPFKLPGDPNCEHDWQRDGQTYSAVRWTCSKCMGSYLW